MLTVRGFRVYFARLDGVSAVPDDVRGDRPDLQSLGGLSLHVGNNVHFTR
jgi:hypothetical protein